MRLTKDEKVGWVIFVIFCLSVLGWLVYGDATTRLDKIRAAHDQGMDLGFAVGWSSGHNTGYTKGYVKGFEEGKRFLIEPNENKKYKAEFDKGI